MMPKTEDPAVRKAFHLVEKGVLVIDMEGKFAFSEKIRNNAVLELIFRIDKKRHPFRKGDIPEADFDRIVSELLSRGSLEEMHKDGERFVSVTRSGGFELMRLLLAGV